MNDATATQAEEQAKLKHRWLEDARLGEDGDPFGGKRGQPRFAWCVPLDVRARSDGQTREYLATACDISAAGIRFHCRKAIELMTPVEIIPCGEEAGLPAVIRHATQTVSGYLIGAEFSV